MTQLDDSILMPPPTKVVVEKLKYVVPPNFRLPKNRYHNNRRCAIICCLIWSIISMVAVFYTIMALRKTIFVTGRLSDDYKEMLPDDDEDKIYRKEIEGHRNVAERYSVAMIFCNNMMNELSSIIAMAMYALLGLINVLSPVLHIYGVVRRDPIWTVPFVFTSGVTFVMYATSVLVLLYAGDVIHVFGFHAAAVLIGVVMLLLMFHPIYQSAFLIEEVNILKNARSMYVKRPRVKSKGGLIHTVSAKTQTATPKKTKPATEKKPNVTTPIKIELIS